MKVKSILLAATGYPTPTDPIATFVAKLVEALSLKGIKVTVIAPQGIVRHWFRHTELHPKKRVYNVGGEDITVLQPYTLSLGERFKRFNQWCVEYVINRTAEKQKELPDICYGHFWRFGFDLYKYAYRHQIPLFVVHGESHFDLLDVYKIENLKPFISGVRGVISVSTNNKNESIKAGFATEEECEVIPNAIDDSVFYKMDKSKLRKEYGYPENAFIVIFVGWFSPAKGTKILSDALTNLNNYNIKAFFLGSDRGNSANAPTYDHILKKNRVSHDEVPKYLNMADVFVLPTLNEGCNNAIVEAMACGLPIISSDYPFNYDICNENNSILVNPLDVDELSSAIKKLYDSPKLCKQLSEGALEMAKNLTISKRADKIINYIESKI